MNTHCSSVCLATILAKLAVEAVLEPYESLLSSILQTKKYFFLEIVASINIGEADAFILLRKTILLCTTSLVI